VAHPERCDAQALVLFEAEFLRVIVAGGTKRNI